MNDLSYNREEVEVAQAKIWESSWFNRQAFPAFSPAPEVEADIHLQMYAEGVRILARKIREMYPKLVKRVLIADFQGELRILVYLASEEFEKIYLHVYSTREFEAFSRPLRIRDQPRERRRTPRPSGPPDLKVVFTPSSTQPTVLGQIEATEELSSAPKVAQA